MIDMAQRLFSGTMIINGNRHASTSGVSQSKAQISSRDQLVNGLRISGRSIQDTESDKLTTQVAASASETDNNADAKTKNDISNKFANEILARCQTTSKSDSSRIWFKRLKVIP